MSIIFFLTFRLRVAGVDFGVSANSRGQSAGGRTHGTSGTAARGRSRRPRHYSFNVLSPAAGSLTFHSQETRMLMDGLYACGIIPS